MQPLLNPISHVVRGIQLRKLRSQIQIRLFSLRTDPAAIERAAREELRLVRPGELVYRLDAQPGGAP